MTVRSRDFRVEQFDDVTIVRITTDLVDSLNYEPIAAGLKELVDDLGARKLLINLEKVEFLYSFALGHFAAILRQVRHDGGDLRFCGLRPAVQQVFGVTQFNRLVKLYDSEQRALERWAESSAEIPIPTDPAPSANAAEMPEEQRNPEGGNLNA